MKQHLSVEISLGRRRTACGNGRNTTLDPKKVTCEQCKHTSAFKSAARQAPSLAETTQPPVPSVDVPPMTDEARIQALREALEYISLCNGGAGHMPELAAKALRADDERG